MEDSDAQLLRASLAAVLNIQEKLSLPHLVALLAIAVEPGLSVNELAERVAIPQQTASRYVAILLGRYENADANQPPLPLIDQELSSTDPRKRALFLNENGQSALKQFIENYRTHGVDYVGSK